ncbi:hypothetical protein [Rhodococcus wratislaviensis]|uniref:Uncharacterized protein n=1 Tax=Rhodococcus wratislaviensis NBRC 100605 TaxID=1219028 RepID=X0Q4Q8_RHOWR|nr:hypothetical protein [Rhodococcus wratislaviensis]GAF45471.1 hypothetical protein RW1_022_00480 [Rhodococcus wratislaviensis NBRC 100605]
MTAGPVRRLVTMLLCAIVVGAPAVACGNDSALTDCIRVVDESGDPTRECLPVASDTARVDLGTPTFRTPTSITNRLHPTSALTQTIYGGQVGGEPFRTEVTRLPGTKTIAWDGTPVETVIVQYVAYLDGRIHEVAIDWFAQADDGSVWYFGEDVSNFEDGSVADTEGTWLAGDQIPAAMIMPAQPHPGDVYRPENAPGVVFEEVRIEKVDQEVASPSGIIGGAIEVGELHMDGTREGKVFVPGYGEFSTGSPTGDLEAVSLASPTDTRRGPAPAEFGALSGAVGDVFGAVAAADSERAGQAATALDRAWDSVRTVGIPPQVELQMQRDIDTLTRAVGDRDSRSAQSAALRIAQNELDLRLLYQRVIDVDLARLALWARQLPVDVAAADTGSVLADVAALDRVWERTRPGVEATASVDTALDEVRRAVDGEDLPADGSAAANLTQAVAGLHAR